MRGVVLLADGFYSLGRGAGLIENNRRYPALWVMTYGGVRMLAATTDAEGPLKLASWTYFIQSVDALRHRPRGWPLITLLSWGMALWTF